MPKKLGIRPDHKVAILNEPVGFRSLLVELPDGVRLRKSLTENIDVVIAFHTSLRSLDTWLDRSSRSVFPDGSVWIAWPKKASGEKTDLTGDIVRERILASGELVDNKVCAIDETWSGLRAVWRLTHR